MRHEPVAVVFSIPAVVSLAGAIVALGVSDVVLAVVLAIITVTIAAAIKIVRDVVYSPASVKRVLKHRKGL